MLLLLILEITILQAPTAAIDGLISQQNIPDITNAGSLNAYVESIQDDLAAGREQVRQAEAALAANPALNHYCVHRLRLVKHKLLLVSN